jgi:hypothetical protein
LTTAERLGVLRRSKSTSFDEVEVDEDGVTTITRVDVLGGTDPVTGLTVSDADVEDAVPGVLASDFINGSGLPG